MIKRHSLSRGRLVCLCRGVLRPRCLRIIVMNATLKAHLGVADSSFPPTGVAHFSRATGRLPGSPSRSPTAPPRQTGGLRTAHEVLWPRPTPHWPPTSPSLARRRVAAQCRSDGAADDKWLMSSVGQGRRLEERAEMRHAVLSAEGGMQPRRPRRVPTYVVQVGRRRRSRPL